MTCVYAGDEDMNPTAYSRFDPETGFMVPIQQPHEGQQQGSSDAMQTPDSELVIAVADEAVESTSFWLYLLLSVTVIAGLAAWIRSKKVQTSPNHLD
jgi:hypothetical protein